MLQIHYSEIDGFRWVSDSVWLLPKHYTTHYLQTIKLWKGYSKQWFQIIERESSPKLVGQYRMFHLYTMIACDAFIKIPIRSNSVIILKKVVWVIYQLRYFRKFLHSKWPQQFTSFIGNSHLVCFYKTIFRKHL